MCYLATYAARYAGFHSSSSIATHGLRRGLEEYRQLRWLTISLANYLVDDLLRPRGLTFFSLTPIVLPQR